MATSKNHKEIFKKVLVEFIGQEDPILSMLEWTAQRMMEIEAEVLKTLVICFNYFLSALNYSSFQSLIPMVHIRFAKFIWDVL